RLRRIISRVPPSCTSYSWNQGTRLQGMSIVGADKPIKERLARLPLVKTWEPDAGHYMGDVAVHEGGVYQARKDTGKETGHADWICIARAGRDGHNGDTPRLRGAFDAHEKYRRFDIAEFDGSSFIALHDDPGIPGDDGWQLLAGRGGKGPSGETGPRGRKGERGARGEATPTIIAWTLDTAHYRAIPTLSNGTQGAVLDLRDL